MFPSVFEGKSVQKYKISGRHGRSVLQNVYLYLLFRRIDFLKGENYWMLMFFVVCLK